MFRPLSFKQRMGWAGYEARMGEMRNVYNTFVRKSQAKRPLGRPRRRWEDNIRTIFGK
jgi:hypothetical protein